MSFEIKQEGKFKYVDEGQGQALVLFHGLLGALSNFDHQVNYFKKKYRVVVPILPLLDLDLLNTSVSGLQKYVNRFFERLNLQNIHLLGNSLGGHVAMVQLLKFPQRIKTLILTGSSGLFENAMGSSYPKRGNKDYIRKKTASIFYDPAMATDELVDEVFEITNNRLKAVKIIALAKSAIRHNLGEELKEVKQPTLLIWGKNDAVTPPFVAEEFHKLIPNSELHYIDNCGHAPMMEVPDEFNKILEQFLDKHP